MNSYTQLIATVHRLANQGWSPATGGNFSCRNEAGQILITASGIDKSQLRPDQVLTLTEMGEKIAGHGRPSAETALHLALYQLNPIIGAVLHTHSVAATAISLLEKGEWLKMNGLEMQKALTGVHSHEQDVQIRIFDNTQNIPELALQLKDQWPMNWGFLVRGHGLYAFGRDLDECVRHIEGLEFLFEVLLKLRSYS